MQTTTSIVAACAALTASASALAGGFDVLLLPDRTNNLVRTGAFDDDTKQVVSENERVFKGAFGEIDPNQPNFSDEPGFRALPGDFPAGDQWGFNLTNAIYRWDPVAGNFDTQSPYTITFGFGPLSVTSPTTPGGFAAGFTITIPGGGFDDHLDIFLDGPTGPEADGIYLARLNVFATGLAPSDNVWFVLNRGLPEAELERAEEYVRDVIVPAPGAAAVLGLAVLGLGRRRR